MEITCHRCGAVVPEGTAFCSNCGAPQIFVKTAAEEDTHGAASAGVQSAGPQAGAIYDPQQLNWRKALPATSKAGVAMGLATFILATLFPVWIVGGGWLAVSLYRRRSFVSEVANAAGAKLGALAGLLGFAFFAIATSITVATKIFVLHQGAQLRALLVAAVDQAASRNPDPRVQPMLEWVRTPEGLAFLIITGLVLLFIAFLILGSLGGLVGASLNRRRGS